MHRSVPGENQGQHQPQRKQGPSMTPRQSTAHIGVMCMDLAQTLEPLCGQGLNWHSYLPGSYVKHLEASGALVIPIWIGRERLFYENIMKKVNGVLLPGGAVFLPDEDKDVAADTKLTNCCVESVGYVYELALERNRAGDYFPIWGTCLGFQLMLKNAVPKLLRTECGKFFDAHPLHLAKDYNESVMFSGVSTELAEAMESISFACHQHKYCITEESLGQSAGDWHVLARRDSKMGFSFITLIEHREFPIFGCQFHPERTAYEQLYVRSDACRESHSAEGIRLAQFFADVFVRACRRNMNRFDNEDELSRHLIFNWQPRFSGFHNDANWLQVYLFPKDVDYVENRENLALP